MALGKNRSTGRADAAQDSVMKKIRKPRFVDNAVRHGQYNKGTAGFKVEAPVQSDFIPATERKYRLFEEEDTIRLVHNTTDGHRYEGAIFLDEDKVTASSTLPALIVGADNPQQSLVPSKIETATKGTRYGLENLKGRSLKEIGFTDKTIRFAQKVGVGLRTSDLATRVANSSKSSINGIKVSVPSTTFVAKDFYGVDSISALRYLAKHDYYSPRSDRFGNLLYVPQTQIEREHFLNENRVSGGSNENNNDAVPNRIVVRGKSRANNDDNVVQIDDFGTQKDTVNEVPGGIHAPTALTKASARRIGQNMLRMAKKASGSMTLNDVLSGTHIQPGDSVNYQSRSNSDRKIVLGGSYDLINRKSQLQVNSVDATLEDVLQRFQEVDISGSLDENYERNRQFSVEEFTTSFGVKMKISWEIAERVDSNRGVGFNLGQPNRDTIHGARRLQSTGVLINNGAGYAINTTSFTTDGVNANSVFTTDNQAVYTKNGNKLGHIHAASVGTNTVVIKSRSVHPVSDNDEIYTLPETLPETRNSHLKVGLVQTKYLRNRRG
jgi:hypothetical protein